jgi:hypothetical protein
MCSASVGPGIPNTLPQSCPTILTVTSSGSLQSALPSSPWLVWFPSSGPPLMPSLCDCSIPPACRAKCDGCCTDDPASITSYRGGTKLTNSIRLTKGNYNNLRRRTTEDLEPFGEEGRRRRRRRRTPKAPRPPRSACELRRSPAFSIISSFVKSLAPRSASDGGRLGRFC